MRLIYESASQRNVAQRPIGLKHVLGSQFDATPDHKGVGGVPETAPKGSRKVRLAAPHQCAQIFDEHATGEMPVDIVERLPYLPFQQTLFAVVRGLCHGSWIKLSSQQRGCLEYRAMRGLFLMKVTDGRIQQRYYIVHPVVSLHAAASDRGTVSAPEKDVDRELQWTKSPPIGGFPPDSVLDSNPWRGP
jgi:hypothetical protein